MATATYAQVARRWYALAAIGDSGGKQLQHPHLRGEGDLLVSNVGDTVMAQIVRGAGGRIRCVVLNGDGGGRRTRFTNQQWEIRGVVQQQVFPNIILPFAALEAAGIEIGTINPIEIRADQWITERTYYPKFDWDDVVWSGRVVGMYYEHGTIAGRTDLMFRRQVRRWDRIEIPVHERDRYREVYGMPNWRHLARSGDRYFSDQQIHRLGDSVFRAKAHGAYRTFLSSFDYQERNPLYFLAELPWKAKVTTVQEAITALAPPIVQQAWKQKRTVHRQGDIFCIPTDLTTEQVKARTGTDLLRMEGVLGTDHVVTESYVGRRGVTYARGWMHHSPEGRRPDHRKISLGKAWHLVVPNAVPRRRAGAMVRG